MANSGTSPVNPIKWPADAVDPTNTDLCVPLRNLLQELNLLETQHDEENSKRGGAGTTPWSLQAITAGSLQLSKVVAALVTSLGGGAALWAAVKGFGISQHDPDRLAYIGAAAVIVSAMALALAVIVRSDVMARAQATAAQYDARARCAAAFLETARTVAVSPRHLARTQDQERPLQPGEFEVDLAYVVPVARKPSTRSQKPGQRP
jgi:hypothetical protein